LCVSVNNKNSLDKNYQGSYNIEKGGDNMNIEEVLVQLLEGQKQMQESIGQLQDNQKQMQQQISENQKATNKRLDEIQQDIEDIKEDGMITREAANHNGEVLEKMLGYLNVPVRYDDLGN